jgi:hypothetical protein
MRVGEIVAPMTEETLNAEATGGVTRETFSSAERTSPDSVDLEGPVEELELSKILDVSEEYRIEITSLATM